MNSQNLNLDICLTQLINTNISGTISSALQDHVLSVDISLEKKTAFVTYNEFGITATKIISIIEDCGFDAKEQFKIMFPKVFMWFRNIFSFCLDIHFLNCKLNKVKTCYHEYARK